MPFRDVLADIKRDIERYPAQKPRPSIVSFIANPGIQATVVYRFGAWLYETTPPSGLLRFVIRMTFYIFRRFINIITGIDLDYYAQIGAGAKIPHFGGIIVGPYVIIGRNCTISHDVTIGFGGRGDKRGTPKIGNRVYIAPGAKIFGPITIGNDVAIGGNAVVTKSIPDRAVIGGVPAQIISLKGSFEFIEYFNMNLDAERQKSLAIRNESLPDSQASPNGPMITDDWSPTL